MANETSSRDNPSRQQTSDRDNSSRQQSSERAQSGVSTTQQGGGSSRSTSGSLAGQGSQNPGTSSGQNASTWQSGRSPQSGALQHRGGSSLSPWSSGFESGYGPFAMMRRISDEMDRLFENFGMGRGLTGYDPQGFGNPQRTQGASSMWSPHVEVMEREGKLVIQADLPGILHTGMWSGTRESNPSLETGDLGYSRYTSSAATFFIVKSFLLQKLKTPPVKGRVAYCNR